MTTLDTRALRTAFGSFMTGVTVVTALDDKGNPLGFTANSFTSVSLDPPLVLVCLANSSRNHAAFVSARGFAVNILSETQIEVSNAFASPVEDRFALVNWHAGPCASPILENVCAWFDCSMHKVIEAGDHAILIGQVEAFDAAPTAALGYARGAYVTQSTATEALERSPNLIVSVLIERDGQVLLIDDGKGGLTLPERAVGEKGASAALQGLFLTIGTEAQPSFIYSVFDDKDSTRQHICFLCQTEDGDPARGAFVALSAETLALVSDAAILSMLERFAAEAKLGNYGIYFGGHDAGDVHPISRRRQ